MAASINYTGRYAEGRDSVLEISSGSIESKAFSLVGMQQTLAVNTAPSFTVGDGKLLVRTGGNDQGRSIIQQFDGKLVVAGYSENRSNYDYSVIRLNGDGSLDAGFGNSGKLLIPIGSGLDKAYSLIQQFDGKLVIAGYSQIGSSFDYDYSLIRLNTDGSLDTGFGDGGKLLLPVGANGGVATSIIQQSDGNLVVAGTSSNADGNGGFTIVRLKSDGTTDNTFAVDGKLLIWPSSGSNYACQTIIQQADGKLVTVGTISYNTGPSDVILFRLNSDGSFDTGFGNNGQIKYSIGVGRDDGYSVIQQDDGKLLVAGLSENGNQDYSLIRLNNDGSIDTGFGSDGKLLLPVGSSGDVAYSIIQQADGKIVAAGSSYNGNNWDFSLIRIDINGTLDSTLREGLHNPVSGVLQG